MVILKFELSPRHPLQGGPSPQHDGVMSPVRVNDFQSPVSIGVAVARLIGLHLAETIVRSARGFRCGERCRCRRVDRR
jgi:hypothetical protein